MRFVVLGDDQATAGFLVESMHDAGPRHAADAAELAFAMMQQRVDERVCLVSRLPDARRVRRFVRDQQAASSNKISSGISSG